MDKTEIQNLIRQEIENYMADKQFNLSPIPNHLHNGTDTNKLPLSSIDEAIQLDGSKGGVSSKTVLGGQIINNQWEGYYKNPSFITELPIPIIYGGGNPISITFTAPLVNATSATLDSPWNGNSNTFAVVFSTGELGNISFTNASDLVSWSSPITASDSATVVGDSIFKGGEGLNGSCVIFSGLEDLYPTIYFRISRDGFTDKWWGLPLTTTPPNFISL